MRALLDTHALIWWLANDTRLSQRARDVIAQPETRIHVSAASAWEIATKLRIGKFDLDATRLHDLPALILKTGFVAMPISITHAHRAGHLANDHRDPFDRMLAAQALVEDMPLITLDSVFKSFGVATIW